MAFNYDNMENIVKATGLTEDELASLIIAKENEGWTNAEIAELLASNFDNKEYASKANSELDTLYSLGFKPSLIDRSKNWLASKRDSIAKSVNDWRDSHPEQWRVGMVNAMFGDNSMLSQHYAAKNAAEESEKNRQSQHEYNQYLKEYDRTKAAAEQSAAYKKELKEAEADLAGLNRDLIKASPTEAAVISKRRETLLSKYPELNSDDSVEKAYEDEQKYKQAKIAAQRALPTTFATDKDIDNAINSIYDNPNLLDEHKDEMIKDLQSKKSTAQLAREASQSAVASHAGQKTGKSLSDADLEKKANDAISTNTSPSRLKPEVLDKIRELNYTWTANGWSKR